jgi:hypothetical protein
VPGGSVPDVENLYGGTPPRAANVTLNGDPWGVAESGCVVMVRGAGLTARVNVLDVLSPDWSAAVTINVDVPGEAGVPVIRPSEDRVSPAGRAPPEIEKV